MRTLAVDLAALGNAEPLWLDWLEDARRRLRIDALEAGPGARARVLERLGAGATVVSTREELLAVT